MNGYNYILVIRDLVVDGLILIRNEIIVVYYYFGYIILEIIGFLVS